MFEDLEELQDRIINRLILFFLFQFQASLILHLKDVVQFPDSKLVLMPVDLMQLLEDNPEL